MKSLVSHHERKAQRIIPTPWQAKAVSNEAFPSLSLNPLSMTTCPKVRIRPKRMRKIIVRTDETMEGILVGMG
jgi:hypothetical protein